MFSGIFSLPWWGDVVVALLLTHVTIAAVTIFLHRHQAHHALDLHPAVSHFVREILDQPKIFLIGDDDELAELGRRKP